MKNLDRESLLKRLHQLMDVGIALSAEKDFPKLLEKILLGAKQLTMADGGTIYTMTDEKSLHFEILHSTSLDLHFGGTSEIQAEFPPLPLYLEDGSPNDKMVSASCALNGKTVVIEDVYEVKDFDFSGTRDFDEKMGYRSKSFMTVPMKNFDGNVIGVLQLINAERGAFSEGDIAFVESLSSQAAIALSQQHLIKDLRLMFESFVQSLAEAIDKMSRHTGDHCRRVPELSMLLAQLVNRTDKGPFANFSFNEDEMQELYFAAWMHDCGKITIPNFIVDKKTRLESVIDRIQLIHLRYEVLMKGADDAEKALLQEEIDFIHQCNSKEFISPEDKERLKNIQRRTWKNAKGDLDYVVTEDELYNLFIARGTINSKEREIIRDHVLASEEILKKIRYPKNLKNIPAIAAAHHERMDGSGYPRGLKGTDIPIGGRILCLVDVFEALTSPERPYKKRYNIEQALKIMEQEGKSFDPALFDLFKELVKEKGNSLL